MRRRNVRSEEQWAQAVVSAHLGLKVERHDDGSQPGMHDYTIILPDGSHAAVEVTMCADQPATKTLRALQGDGKVWTFPQLRGGWWVCVHPHANVRRLRKELPSFLGRLERAGITQPSWQPTPRWVEWTSQRLGIAVLEQGDTRKRGSVYLTIELSPDQSGGAVPHHGDSISEWISAFLVEPEQQDILTKLGRAGTDQRHVFVFVPFLTLAGWPVPYLLMSDPVPLPVRKPQLPAEVAHVWIASMWNTETGVRWAPEVGWEHFSKQIHLQAS